MRAEGMKGHPVGSLTPFQTMALLNFAISVFFVGVFITTTTVCLILGSYAAALIGFVSLVWFSGCIPSGIRSIKRAEQLERKEVEA